MHKITVVTAVFSILIKHEMVYLCALRSRWKEQLDLAHGTKNGKNKEKTKNKKAGRSEEVFWMIMRAGWFI